MAVALLLLTSVSFAETDPPTRLRGKLFVSPVAFEDCARENVFARGDNVILTGTELAPNEPVEIAFIQGDTEHALPPGKANTQGALNVRVVIPPDAATDSDAKIRVTAARGASGTGLVLNSGMLQIFADARDSDGDGIKDMCDLCPKAKSDDNFDSDGDGLGDPCDPCPTDVENGAGTGKCADDNPNPDVPLAQPSG